HWVVIDATDDQFFEITKRLHNRLHETAGDGGPLGDFERGVYERSLDHEREEFGRRVAPGDVVVLHDPQTVGLAPCLSELGAHVLWRCHIGVDEPGPMAHESWEFLRRYVDCADRMIFSRPAYVWDGLRADDVVIMAP